ncbi:MAG: hypothetical protein LBP24_00850 [Coriobacteriales bacterium]|jgi:uncharacterized protein (UPF0333 family)|nr:hypothetical protein [Coriobacteriales bacterium]
MDEKKHLTEGAMMGTSGQATIEYLIVGLILIIVIAALGLLVQAFEDGLFVEHAAQSASHAITNNTAGAVGDVLLY